ncbi:MAG: LD-carboxypeptidase, partial [Bacteroidia bacterium]|nr:LD-carboxypeptidase [Bacteroidia bacterium]
VNFKPLKKLPKWIVGYSDITALHSCLHNLGLQSLHATMPINFFKNKEALQSLKDALFGNKLNYKVKPSVLNRSGKARGQVIGGNLSLLYALSGCKEDLDTKNKILFIEDLDEYLYHIDRMMMQLKRSGKLKNLKALIVGGMSDMKDNKIPFGKTSEQIILEAVSEYKYPVCFNFPAGHIDRNLAIVLGKEASLNITKTKVEFNYL